MFKGIAVAVALFFAPVAASAITVSGQIDIGGSVNLLNSDFSIGGNVDLNDPGFVALAPTGDFAGIAQFTNVALVDIDFGAPGTIWTVGDFSFVATAFKNIVDDVTKGFTAIGFIADSSGGFEDTTGTLSFSTQAGGGTSVSFSSTTVVPLPAAGLLLISAFGGLVFMRRRQQTI